MTTHARAMSDRLPLLYRDGELVQQFLGVPAVALEVIDEDGLNVQRAHWFDRALDLLDAARLAAVLDIAPEPWQGIDEYRGWVHALRDAMLQRGAVTPGALQQFIRDYVRSYRAATGSTAVAEIGAWADRPGGLRPAFAEFPPRRRYERAPVDGGIEPLFQFSVEQRGLDETPAAFLLTGLPAAPECAPLIANLTRGEALLYLGSIPPGARLWLRPLDDGTMSAQLEGVDVSTKLRSISGLEPGTPWRADQIQSPARALMLGRGRNDLWCLPVAHFDIDGLDRVLLSLADLLMQQGRYDITRFDHALFIQEPALLFRMTWLETQPATVEITLPGGALLYREGERDESILEREQLSAALGTAVERLRATGVRTSVTLAPFGETVGMQDRLTMVLPLVHREVASMGADRLPDAGALFDVTSFDDSTFR